MRRRVKVKSNGWITTVRRGVDSEGNTIWIEDLTDTKYYTSELEFLFAANSKGQHDNSNEPFAAEDIVAFDPMQMEFDPVTMTGRFFQQCHLQITQEVIQAALQCASDKQLQEEVKRRADERRALKGQVLRCRDCKHCIQGYASRYAAYRGDKTSVCEMKPKDKAWRGCFYSTLQSRKACEQFEPK